MHSIVFHSHQDIKDHTGWYFVSHQQVAQAGGSGLLNHYHGSLLRALHAVYPSHEWTPWRFSSKSPHNVSKAKFRFSKTQYYLHQQLQNVSMLQVNADVEDISWSTYRVQLSIGQ